jgi:hypothetical protein
MKSGYTLMAILFIAIGAARAQVVPANAGPAATNPAATSPAATSPAGLPVGGTLHYGLNYAQTTQFGNSQEGQQWSIISGDAGYANTGRRLPFSMQYGGGFAWAWNGPPSAGNVFQHLSLSQGIVWRAWNLSASDNVSYSFQTPTTGFSGVPGTGEPIGEPGSTPLPDQTVLTTNTRSLDNFTTIGIGHRLDYATTLNLGGSWGQMLFIDNNGQNTETLAANAGISRRLNARNSVSGQYSFSRFNFGGAKPASPANTPQISYGQANTAQFGFSRQWNGKISSSASVGPDWVSSSNSALEPSSTSVSAGVSASDTLRFGTASLSYGHGTSGGAGYMLGAESDVVNGGFSRRFGKRLGVGLTGSYMRTAALNGNGATSAKFGGAQATRSLGRYFNLFANYTAAAQSSSALKSANVLNGLNQVIGFGIGYSPRETHLKK